MDAPPRSLVSRLLFVLTALSAAGLAALVLVAPVLVGENSSRLLTLFATDATLRRTTLASAAGLAVTAWVFFRRTAPPDDSNPLPPPPGGIAGA